MGPDGRALAGPLQQQRLGYQAPHPHAMGCEDEGFEFMTLWARFLPAMDGQISITVKDHPVLTPASAFISNPDGHICPLTTVPSFCIDLCSLSTIPPCVEVPTLCGGTVVPWSTVPLARPLPLSRPGPKTA